MQTGSLSKTESFSTNKRDPLTLIRMKHGSLTTPGAKHEIRIKICTALNQLNDSDARCVGLDVLRKIITNIDAPLLPLVFNCLYPLSKETSMTHTSHNSSRMIDANPRNRISFNNHNHQFMIKPLCRKEYALLYGYIATQRGNTKQVFKSLSKLCHSLLRASHDNDNRVRIACADSFAKITKCAINYQIEHCDLDSKYKTESYFNAIDGVLNRICRPIYKSFIEKKSTHPFMIAGNLLCLSAIIEAADSNLSIYQIKHMSQAMLGCVNSIRDQKSHVELLKCIQTLIVCAGTIITGHKSQFNGSGNQLNNDIDIFSSILAIIMDSFSHNDWMVRNAGLNAIHAIGLIFGSVKDKPEIESNRQEIMAHLQRLRFDKVSNVRKTATIAQTVWSVSINNKNNKQNNSQDSMMNHISTASMKRVTLPSLDKIKNKYCNNQRARSAGAVNDLNNPMPEETELDLEIQEMTHRPWFDTKSQIDSKHELKKQESSHGLLSASSKSFDESVSKEEKTNDAAIVRPITPAVATDNVEIVNEQHLHANKLHKQLLQQQQLMLKSMKNLESFVKREISEIKSRVHTVERDVHRFLIDKQNENQNQNQTQTQTQHHYPTPPQTNSNHNHNQINHQKLRYVKKQRKTWNLQPRRNIEMMSNPRTFENNTEVNLFTPKTVVSDNDAKLDQSDAQSENGCNSTTMTAAFDGDNEDNDIIDDTCTMSCTDNNDLNINEQLLQIIQLDNNILLVQWLNKMSKYILFEYVDQRLMISLLYRVTQMLKNNEYVTDIATFIKKEFAAGKENIPKNFSLPNPLKQDFMDNVCKYEDLKSFSQQIADCLA